MSVYSDLVLSRNPLVYYRRGELAGPTCEDETGQGRDGTYSDSPTFGAPGLLAGDPDTAVRQDGIAVAQGTSTPDAAWMHTNVFTAECWIRATNHAASACVFARGSYPNQGSADSWRIMMFSGEMRVVTTSGSTPSTPIQGINLTINTTYHVVLTCNTNTVSLYINGALVAGPTAVSNVNTGTFPFTVGMCNIGSTEGENRFDGTIDEVALYGFVLSPAEIAENYEYGTNPPILPDDPTGVSADCGRSSATLTWSAAANATGYEVRVNGGASIDVGDTLTYLFTGLTESTSYEFEVRSYNDDGFSDWVSVSCTTSGAPTFGWRVVLNGVTLDGGSDSDAVSGISGCLTAPPDGLGVPGLRTEDVTYPQRDGVAHFADWYEPRIVTLTDVSVCTTDCPNCPSTRQNVRVISSAWSRHCDDTELVVFTDCHNDDTAVTGGDRVDIGPYGIIGRPRVAATQWIGQGSKCATMLLRFDSLDHRMYLLDPDGTPGSGEQCLILEPAIDVMCRSYPRCYPLCYDTAVTGTDGNGPQEIDNYGTLCAPLTITLTGPLTTPTVTNETTGQDFTYRGTITAGNIITVNTETGEATDQDAIPRTHLLDGDTTMWADVGENTFRLTSLSPSDTGFAQVCFRPSVLSG